uniref:Uncharacterized protein n=1 Tax=Helianthus annuus TaxID=4232 RepID=A0A251TSH1_HELAN
MVTGAITAMPLHTLIFADKFGGNQDNKVIEWILDAGVVTRSLDVIHFCRSWAIWTESWREYRTGIVEDAARVEMVQR